MAGPDPTDGSDPPTMGMSKEPALLNPGPLASLGQHLVPLLCVAAAVGVANIPASIHLVSADPRAVDAGLNSGWSGVLPGMPNLDTNVGDTTQALGHLVALQWLHGHVPWWNPYEGVGAPLAGEMQSGAFFPPIILLAFSQGMLMLQLLLELVTGCSTYFLARRLGVGRTLSTAAGAAFGLCGTFAWFAHAPVHPVVLLPLGLLGIERAIDASTDHRRGGWGLLAISLALSILAGFPETAIFDGLLVILWSALRLAELNRSLWRSLVLKLCCGLAVGIGLAAPLIVAFADYLPDANIGGHGGAISHTSLPPQGLAQLILPYALGPLFGFHTAASTGNLIGTLWGRVGGYLTVTLVAAAIVGMFGRRHRILRLGLALWVIASLLRTYGFSPLVHLMAMIPVIRDTAMYRYADPSWELAVVVLAALGLDDVARGLTGRRTIVVSAVVTGMFAAVAAAVAWNLTSHVLDPTGREVTSSHVYVITSLAAVLFLLTLLAIGGSMAGMFTPSNRKHRVRSVERGERRRKRGRILMALVIAAESVLLLSFTYLSAPIKGALGVRSAAWLQTHLDTSRFVSLGPIQPDYGSYFDIGEINTNDLPLPSTWTNYVSTHLDTNVNPLIFTGYYDPPGPSPAKELTEHLANYEALGARYVIENGHGTDAEGTQFPAANAPPWPRGPRLVFHNNLAEIWQLPSPAPLFSLRPGGDRGPAGGSSKGPCTVSSSGWSNAEVHCDTPSVLIRRVQSLPGWQATITRQSGASSAPVHAGGPGHLFQEVEVPAGTSTVDFTYLPKYEPLALLVSLISLVVLIAGTVVAPRWNWRRPDIDDVPAHGIQSD